ncbi:MAG: hypothetical protein H6729_12335 [Deltaproteobacteria bacterium]|nr:hypothetical protein [Deltaproteobacteria bacterium]
MRHSGSVSRALSGAFGFDRSTITVGHETFLGVPGTGGVFLRQRINVSGASSRRDPVSLALDASLYTQFWGLPGGGFGYALSTDSRLTGSTVHGNWGPVAALHHPDYGDAVGLLLPGIGGLFVGREIVAVGASVGTPLRCVREGGYVFLRHPAIKFFTAPMFYCFRAASGLPLIERRFVTPMRRSIERVQSVLSPLRRAEDRFFLRGARALDRVSKIVGITSKHAEDI